MADALLQWHDGFHASLQIELQGEAAHLEFYPEHELYKKALRVDILVIKNSDLPVQKKIGKIFRKHNLIEYKSPDDTLNINDFYKVYGYACLYQSRTDLIHEISMEDVSITFVCSHYPRKMLKILKSERGIEAELTDKGIYRLKNDSIAMQIVLINRIPPEENRWLSSLTKKLPMNDNTRQLLREYQQHKNSLLYQSAMDLIMQANKEILEGEQSMVSDVLKEIFKDEWNEKELRMQEIKSQIQQKELRMQEIKSQIQQKELRMQEIKSQIQQKELQMQEKESQMQEKESQMQEIKFQIQQKESQIRDRELLLQKKEENNEKREQRLNSLIRHLLRDNFIDDLKVTGEDNAYLEQMYQRYGL